jgi:hypothetical protein
MDGEVIVNPSKPANNPQIAFLPNFLSPPQVTHDRYDPDMLPPLTLLNQRKDTPCFCEYQRENVC